MNTLKRLMVYSYLLLSFTACTQDDEPIKDYQTCCGIEPVVHIPEFIDGSKSYLYVPNAFTPNSDGINDIFSGVFNDEISHFEYIIIEQDVTDQTMSPIIYQRQNITRENLKDTGWNGLRTDGKIHKGAFNYTIYAVTKDGRTFSTIGRGCAIACDNDATYFRDKVGCFFPIQTDTKGMLDKSIKVGEESCFGK